MRKGFVFLPLVFLIAILFISVLFFKSQTNNLYSGKVTPTPETKPAIPLKEMQENIQRSRERVTESERLTEVCVDKLSNSQLKNEPNGDYGSVSGRVWYPGEGYTDGLLACAYDLENNFRYCNSNWEDKDNGRYYKLNLPSGSYYVYLLSGEVGIGLGAPGKANDYRIIEDEEGKRLGAAPLIIDIEPNFITENIDIGDDFYSKGTDPLYCKELY